MARPTIARVAETASVSKATVSRVLSGNAAYMHPEIRARVLEAIDKLDYRSSSSARSLTSKRTFTAGLLVSDIGNPSYPEVINGIEVGFEAGIQAAVDHLGSLGHTQLAHVAGPMHLRTSRLRHDAFCTATEMLAIPPEQVTVFAKSCASTAAGPRWSRSSPYRSAQ